MLNMKDIGEVIEVELFTRLICPINSNKEFGGQAFIKLFPFLRPPDQAEPLTDLHNRLMGVGTDLFIKK